MTGLTDGFIYSQQKWVWFNENQTLILFIINKL